MSKNRNRGKVFIYGESKGKWNNKELEKYLPQFINEARSKAYTKMNNVNNNTNKVYQHKKFDNLNAMITYRMIENSDSNYIASRTQFLTELNYFNIKKYDEDSRRECKRLLLSMIDDLNNNKSLHSLCSISINSIAKYLNSYDNNNLHYVFDSLPSEFISLLSLYSSIYNTINDENISIFKKSTASILSIGGLVSIDGMKSLCSKQLIINSLDDLSTDSWEEIDLSQLDFTSANIYIKELILFNNSVDISLIGFLSENIIQLEKLHFYKVKLSSNTNNSINNFEDDSSLDLDKSIELFYFLIHELKYINHLNISFCSWLSESSLLEWLNIVCRFNKHHNRICSIRSIDVSGLITNKSNTINISDLIDKFNSQCNIMLNVTYWSS